MSRRRLILFAALLLLFVALLSRGWEREPVRPTEGGLSEGSRANSPGAKARPAGEPSSPGDPRRVGAEISRTVALNSMSGRMVFLDFAVEQTGMRLLGATGASGRAKAQPARHGFGFLEFEVFDDAGRRSYVGSVPDPTQQWLEHPDDSGTGRIESTVISNPEGRVAVRLPGESHPARIVFFRPDERTATGRALGEFWLRAESSTIP